MDNWEEQLINWLNQTENNFNNFCDEITQELEKTATNTELFIDNITKEIEQNIPPQIEEFLLQIDDFFEQSMIFLSEEILSHILEDFPPSPPSEDDLENHGSIIWFDEEKVNPDHNFHPACMGCKNYHGRRYNGNLLVCGIHPYGWRDENCPDWQED
ncbi:hypothetical protein IQ215_04590 [Cyanobacterium stanieri LEGE 03274]|uniref:Uncharacterized protein n=1 Tax=Cyanobacterium stanieri LEGE 03274 TaxID=1828756 RepID=A0ABR9V252_9CHRO|nr:hypothetical protein [Cyanobacterium stanieri]MBE9221970.1 hypothetical protein [Cyanobacterium stanieri LEGE 03274]